MERYKKRDYDHTDESEVFKYKSLMASRNRKRMSKILFPDFVNVSPKNHQ